MIQFMCLIIGEVGTRERGGGRGGTGTGTGARYI